MSVRVVLMGLVAVASFPLLPVEHWHRPHVPRVPTHIIGSTRVARCQPLAAGWDPSQSDTTLNAWSRCMRLQP